MQTILYVHCLVVTVAWGKCEVIRADLSEFSLAGPGSGEYALDGLDDARWVLGCDDGIGMLVEPHMAGFEELGELVAVFEAIKTTRPANENVYTQICARSVFSGDDGRVVLRRGIGGRDGQGDSRDQR